MLERGPEARPGRGVPEAAESPDVARGGSEGPGRAGEGVELGGHGGTVPAQLLPLRRVRGDLVLVQRERRGHRAVHEPQAAPVVVEVLQAVQQERMRGALAGEDDGDW